jgi:hypothetical protein
MKAYNKKGLTIGSIAEKSTETYIVSKHDFAPRLPTITKGHKLTGLTHVVRTNQNSQVSPLSKTKTMPHRLPTVAYHEPNQLVSK